jgi:hypothetical protein
VAALAADLVADIDGLGRFSGLAWLHGATIKKFFKRFSIF